MKIENENEYGIETQTKPNLETKEAKTDPKLKTRDEQEKMTTLIQNSKREINTNKTTTPIQKMQKRKTKKNGKRRPRIPRQFLIPGTSQYASLCMNTDKEEQTSFILECMESQRNDETLLTKELEFLMACANMKDEPELEQEVNLKIPDPKSQKDKQNGITERH